MSTTRPQYGECRRCGDEHPIETAVAQFCSEECRLRDAGGKQLRNIARDHRFCTACFRQVKEIERPPGGTSVVVGPVAHAARSDDAAADVLVGYQYRTRHATTGEREGRAIVTTDPTDPHAGERPPSPGDRLAMTGTICECGTTDHRDDWARGAHVTDLSAAAERLVGILDWVGREGQQDKTIDARTLYRTLTESIRETDEPDWPLAVGRALE